MTWRPSLEAKTTSRPHGDIDIEPTGCSTWKELSSPNVGLSKAEVRGLGSMGADMLTKKEAGLNYCSRLYHGIAGYLDIMAVQRVSGESYAALPDSPGVPISGTARIYHWFLIISDRGSRGLFRGHCRQQILQVR